MAKVEVEMPQMGESVMEGTVIEWKKKVGETVEVDETLLEIATDKVDTEVPSPEAGVLLEILVEEDETVEVGQTIAVIDTEGEPFDVSNDSSSKDENNEASVDESAESNESDEQDNDSKEPAETDQTDESSPDEDENEDEGERIEIEMPQMGESVMEGTVIEWAKNVGDKVEVDETLLEIATDKVDTEVPSPSEGYLAEILVEEGDTVEVGQTIAIITTGKPSGKSKAPDSSKKKGQKSEETSSSAKASGSNGTAQKSEKMTEDDTSKPQRKGSDGRFYSPLVRSIASEEGISQEELESIEGSGKDGRVSKEDILSYVEDKKAGKIDTPSTVKGKEKIAKAAGKSGEKGKISAGELDLQRPHENVEIVKMDRMRKVIAEHMVRSKQTSAHVTTFSDADVTNIVKWRQANKQKFYNQTGYKLTYTPIFIEAFIQAIGEFPLINSSVNGDEIHLKKDINFGLAVALGEGGKGGLIVPVIKQAQNKNLAGIAQAVHELADKARNKDLSPDDLVGGTITLTNYGSVGNLMGTPIINQPQVAILGTGVIEKRPVVLETDQGDVIAIRHKMYLSMSYDHRIIDGAHGGAFMGRVKDLLENFDTDRAI